MVLKLASHNGHPVVKHAAKRAYWVYYYKHHKSMGFDKVTRASTSERAIGAATRKVLREGFTHVDIFLDDQFLTARIDKRQGVIRIHVANRGIL
jgi:molybdopterin-guanine dinucleotide biosynthesis protein